jgi:ABC-type branched-subunit amino acid transport system ATPase component
MYEGKQISGMPAQIGPDGHCYVARGERCFANLSVRENLEMETFIHARTRKVSMTTWNAASRFFRD